MPFKLLSLAIQAAAASQMALASPATSTLQFQGAVKGTTCNISVDGVETSNPATVILEPADLAGLSSGDSARAGSFKIDLKNCSGSPQVAAIFETANGGTTTSFGSLQNMATDDPAKNIILALEHHFNGYVRQIKVGDGPSSAWFTSDIEDGLKYKLRYDVYGGKATEGNFEAAVQFTVLYQ